MAYACRGKLQAVLPAHPACAWRCWKACRQEWACGCREFARGVDLLTVEIEHIDADALVAVQQELGVDVEPTPGTLRLIQVIDR